MIAQNSPRSGQKFANIVNADDRQFVCLIIHQTILGPLVSLFGVGMDAGRHKLLPLRQYLYTILFAGALDAINRRFALFPRWLRQAIYKHRLRCCADPLRRCAQNVQAQFPNLRSGPCIFHIDVSRYKVMFAARYDANAGFGVFYIVKVLRGLYAFLPPRQHWHLALDRRRVVALRGQDGPVFLVCHSVAASMRATPEPSVWRILRAFRAGRVGDHSSLLPIRNCSSYAGLTVCLM